MNESLLTVWPSVWTLNPEPNPERARALAVCRLDRPSSGSRFSTGVGSDSVPRDLSGAVGGGPQPADPHTSPHWAGLPGPLPALVSGTFPHQTGADEEQRHSAFTPPPANTAPLGWAGRKPSIFPVVSLFLVCVCGGVWISQVQQSTQKTIIINTQEPTGRKECVISVWSFLHLIFFFFFGT